MAARSRRPRFSAPLLLGIANVTALVAGGSVASAQGASAQPASSPAPPDSPTPGTPNEALAADLFQLGVRKMQDGGCEQSPVRDKKTCEEARDAFRRAFALHPAALGTLRNLAQVSKALGHVASATRSFRELAVRAPSDPRPTRRAWADLARREIEELAPRLPYIQVDVGGDMPTGTRVTIDEEVQPREAWSTELPIDPGSHVVKITAPGFVPYSERVDLVEGERRRVAPHLPPIARETPPMQSEASNVAPWIVVGAGAVVTATGLGLGYAAYRKHEQVCDANDVCTRDGFETGRNLARASTWVTSAGLLTVATGIVWRVLSPSGGSASTTGLRPDVQLAGSRLSVTVTSCF